MSASESVVQSNSLRLRLEKGCEQFGLALNPSQYELLLRYLSLLEKWNKAYNLSAIRDPEQMLSLHLLDSLSIAPRLLGARFIDVGTGGGLPGIPLAISFPARNFVLLDSNGKKTRFLFQVKQELGLDNVEVVQSRAQDYHPVHGFDGVISRAFASLGDMLASSRHLLTAGGKYYAMKGQKPQQELAAVEGSHIIESCEALQVPECTGQRHLIIMSHANPV